MPVNSAELPDSTPLDPQKVVLFSADRWKQLTYGSWRTSRSPALVSVDNLIRECDVANRAGSLNLGQVRSLKTALEEWKATKTDYRHSRRNRSMCVELLELYISRRSMDIICKQQTHFGDHNRSLPTELDHKEACPIRRNWYIHFKTHVRAAKTHLRNTVPPCGQYSIEEN